MKNRRRFGEYVGKAAAAVGELIREEDIPVFLSRPNMALGQKSPLAVIWQDGKRGLKRVLNLIEMIASGSFS